MVAFSLSHQSRLLQLNEKPAVADQAETRTARAPATTKALATAQPNPIDAVEAVQQQRQQQRSPARADLKVGRRCRHCQIVATNHSDPSGPRRWKAGVGTDR